MMPEPVRERGGSKAAEGEGTRVEGTISPGRVRRSIPEGASPPLVTQPRACPESKRYELLDAHAFRNAVCAYIAANRNQEFTLVVLKPDTPARTVRLAEVVLDTFRASSGDLAGSLDGALAVFLRTANRPEVTPFLERVIVAWRGIGFDPPVIEIADHPAQEHRVIDLLSADWMADDHSLGSCLQ